MDSTNLLGMLIPIVSVMCLLSFNIGLILGSEDRLNLKNRSYGKHLCCVHLHNALHYIQLGKYNKAYNEVCDALIEVGDTLNLDERITKLRNEKQEGGKEL